MPGYIWFNDSMLWIVTVTIFLIPTYLLRYTVLGIPTTFLEILIYIGVVWLIISQPLALTIERLRPVLIRYWLPIFLILLGAGVGTVIAPDTRDALGLLKAYIVDPILFFGVLTAAFDVKERPRQLEIIFLSVLALGFAVALSSFFVTGGVTDGRSLGVYALDTTASPNFLSLLLAPICALALVGALFGGYKLYRFVAFIMFGAMLAGLVLSGSRGGLLALAAASGVVVLTYIYKQSGGAIRKMVAWLVPLFLVLALFVGIAATRPNFSSSASQRETTSNNLRYEIWRTTVIDILPTYWLTGVGLGNYQTRFTEITQDRVNFPEYISPWARTPHNFFLTIWTNFGLTGLLGFIGILILAIDNLLRAPKQHQTYQIGLVAMLLVILVHGFVDATYWKNDLALLFWLILGLSHLISRDDIMKLRLDGWKKLPQLLKGWYR